MTQKLVYAGLTGMAMLTAFSFSKVEAQVTADHIAMMKSVTGSSISDKGDYVAYTLTAPADPKKENAYSQQHLYVYDAKAKTSKAYFTTSSVSQVNFRPKSGTVTFLSRQGDDKTNALYEINIMGGEAKKVFSHSSNISSYSWSKDGSKIAFVSVEKATKPKTALTYSPSFFEEEYNNRKAYIVPTRKPLNFKIPSYFEAFFRIGF